ncbi:ComEC family competence protein [Saccharicrinis fermentans DSM 9555 = JCM 21142]|uniref:ComEC family competence protein n=2 Tax=Saccharicrinis fermentans TaxID=982 RepID=W7Y5N6_9BACT|nr:ComEC family competence protein [Saccharicrinis fermentans DSM 9555 = JCM 21142]
MEITILMDNEKNDLVYRSEHGLSMLIEWNGTTVLFDTGKSDAFMQNAKLLGKDLTKVDYVVLSHGHYDHTGGLEAFLIFNKKAKIILKKEALDERWSVSQGYNRKIGFPLRKRFEQLNERYMFVDETQEIVPGLIVFTDIAKQAGHTFTDSYLFVQQNHTLVPDTFKDELFMAAVHNDKLTVFTGCAHNGVENMIRTAIEYTGIKKVEFVVGGTHLNRASEQQVKRTIMELGKFDIEKAAFNHCSGLQNIPRMAASLRGDIEYGYAGTRYVY